MGAKPLPEGQSRYDEKRDDDRGKQHGVGPAIPVNGGSLRF